MHALILSLLLVGAAPKEGLTLEQYRAMGAVQRARLPHAAMERIHQLEEAERRANAPAAAASDMERAKTITLEEGNRLNKYERALLGPATRESLRKQYNAALKKAQDEAYERELREAPARAAIATEAAKQQTLMVAQQAEYQRGLAEVERQKAEVERKKALQYLQYQQWYNRGR